MPDRVGLDLATLLVTTLLSNYNQSALIYNGHNFSSGECLYFEENQIKACGRVRLPFAIVIIKLYQPLNPG